MISNLESYAPAAMTTFASPERSDRYAHLTTSEVVDVLAADGWALNRATQSSARSERGKLHGKHVLDFHHPDLPVVNEEYRPRLVLQNASDGTSAVRMFAGFFRFVCANGMVTGDAAMSMVARHSGKGLQDAVVQGAAEIRGNMDRMVDRIERWGSTEISAVDGIEFAKAACKVRWPKAEMVVGREGLYDFEDHSSRAIDVASALRTRRCADDSHDLWSVFNRVQEAVTKGLVNQATFRDGYRDIRSTRRVSSAIQDLKINRELWNVAEELATAYGLN